jgi:predicted Zn-dependent protease
MDDEIRRTVDRLETEKLGKPYFVSASIEDDLRMDIESSFGGVKNPGVLRRRTARVILRVGSAAFDNAHYVGKDYWRYAPSTEGAPVEDDYDAARAALWSAADEAYKAAVEKLSQKKAYKNSRNITEDIPDLAKEEVRETIGETRATPFDLEEWSRRARRLSCVFKKFPAIQSSSVNVTFHQTLKRFADSEGRKSLAQADDLEIFLSARAQAKDGMPVSDQRRILRRGLSDLPDDPSLEAEASRLASDVSALAQAPPAETYLGPVLLEGQASGEFFNQLLARGISSPRELWVEDEGVKDAFLFGKLASRLDLRVLSPLLDAFDDPSLSSHNGIPLAGHYAVDDEGIPPRRVQVAEKGLLKDLPMCRSPIRERSKSNGHGRGSFHEFPTARIGNLFIQARGGLGDEDLRRELLKRASEFGLDYGIVVRRIAEEDRQEKGDLLAAPVLAFKVFVKDGREELVRNAEFSGVTLRSLRDVAAASESRGVYNFYQLGPYRPYRGRTQASIVAPSVLLSELELKRTERKPEKPPFLKHPFFD